MANRTIHATVLTSRLVGTRTQTRNNVESTQDLFLNTTRSGEKFFSNEDLKGQGVMLTERKKGDKYTVKNDDGTSTEKEVLTDGWQFDGSIGSAEQISAIQKTEDALAQLFK